MICPAVVTSLVLTRYAVACLDTALFLSSRLQNSKRIHFQVNINTAQAKRQRRICSCEFYYSEIRGHYARP